MAQIESPNTYLFLDANRGSKSPIKLNPEEHAVIGINIPHAIPGYATVSVNVPNVWFDGGNTTYTTDHISAGPDSTVTWNILVEDDWRRQIYANYSKRKLVALTAKVTLDSIAAMWLIMECHKGHAWLMNIAQYVPFNPKQHTAMKDRLIPIEFERDDDPALVVLHQILAWYNQMPGLTLQSVVEAFGTWVQNGECDEETAHGAKPLAELVKSRAPFDSSLLLWHAQQAIKRKTAR